jgi:hypothetical protein
VRIYNLTDVKTPTLESASLVNVSIKVGAKIVEPGKYIELPALPATAGRLQRAGALYCGHEPPAAYKAAKKSAESKSESPAKSGEIFPPPDQPVVAMAETEPPPFRRRRDRE